MVNTLLRLVVGVIAARIPLFELGGAAGVVAGITHNWGGGWGLIAGGVALLAKSADPATRTKPQPEAQDG